MRYKVVAWIFVIMAILAIASSIYNWQVSRQVVDTTPIIHRDPTAEWKTYTNDQYEFEFKYPGDAKINGPNKNGAGFSVDINYKGLEGLAPPRLLISTVADGRNLIMYTSSNMFSGENLLEKVYEGENPIEFKLTGKSVYANCINYFKDSAVIDFCNQILSTFKFTDSTTKTDTSKNEFTKITIGILSDNPVSFLNTKVEVTGKLILTGKNYFLEPYFAISDGVNKFTVISWLPLEVVVPPSGSPSSTNQPKTMRDLLDKNITLQGVVEQGGKEGFFLGVTKAF